MLNNMYLLHEPDFGIELKRSVLFMADRRALCRLIEGEGRIEPDDRLVPEEPSVDRTMTLIDAFLGTLPEDALSPDSLAQSIAGGDYMMQYLNDTDMSEEDTPLADIIGQLSGNVSESAETSESKASEASSSDDAINVLMPEETLDESYFTETLAKIYIKQKKYSRALEIIRSLYLQFPEKNAYFADQIRFLEKLIINNNLK
jgi:predicted Zn-dependent protease